MEGFLQRSVTIPNWTLPSFTPGKARFRLRYWLNRLPTLEEIKRRGERQDDTCPRCHLAKETQTHCIVDCTSNVALLHKFRIKILRTMRTRLNIFPPQISAREVRSQLLLRRIPCQIVKGWSLTTYDNHDRGKVLLQREHLLNIENISHIPARVHHITSSHTHLPQKTPSMHSTPYPPHTR